MTTLQGMIKELNDMSKKIRSAIKITLYEESIAVLRDIRNSSPEDTGLYRSRWMLSRNRFSGGNIVESRLISNNTPYGYWMEEGAEVGGPPWYFPNPKKKATGRLVEYNGRIWAGGLRPGSSLSKGGAINNVIFHNENRQKKIAQALADSIIKVI